MKNLALALSLWLAASAAAQETPIRVGQEAPAPEDQAPSEAPAPRPSSSKSSAQSSSPGAMPTEVVIKGSEASNKLGVAKPPIRLDIDPYESIRPSLITEPTLLLAISPLTVSWRKTHPDFLYNERVIQPWRTAFSQRPGIVFRIKDQLADALQRKLDSKEAKRYAWTLTIADEEGRVFHHYEGSDNPPEELLWSGQNEGGEWIRAGRSYSAIYTFTDPGGVPRTVVGKPLLFRGIVHQEDTGFHITLDSAVLFGSNKSEPSLQAPAGRNLMRAAADLIKRRFAGLPVAVRVFAQTKELGDSQAGAIVSFMVRELMVGARNVTPDAARAAYGEQRVELVLLNR